jgi:ComF family protein
LSEIDAGKPDCAHCRGSRFHFRGVTGLGVYTGPLRGAVLRMKHPHGELLALALGQLLAARLETTSEAEFDLIVPMPMHWLRRIARGVNCPELLAEPISRRLGVAADTGLLRFRRKAKQQSTLAPTLRRRNLRRALAVSPGYALAGAKILLVDDILTTGATASEAARVLKTAGAESVHVAVAARGIGFD